MAAMAAPDGEPLVDTCFAKLESQLFGTPAPGSNAVASSKYGKSNLPLFVTWKQGPAKNLRGCIGTFGTVSVATGIQDYAITSAIRDHRFSPITREEFQTLHCAVSLLVDFEPGTDYLDWTVGTHGIRIELRTNRGTVNATYLPEIAAEQGWTKVETIDSLLRKGGFQEAITDTIRQAIKLVRYQSAKYQTSYNDWRARTAAG